MNPDAKGGGVRVMSSDRPLAIGELHIGMFGPKFGPFIPDQPWTVLGEATRTDYEEQFVREGNEMHPETRACIDRPGTRFYWTITD